MVKIKKILIANRGEITLRIMRSAKEMGIATVAVYSEADRNSPHVKYADEAVCIGPPPSSQSYLNSDKLIAAAKLTGADAIHPGYGFLSENAAFAQKIEDAGLIFIGPSAHSISVMGSKISAKNAAAQYNIPMVPGTKDAIKDVEEAKAIADKIGYPILLKASAGGGGKGMRIVHSREVFEEEMNRAVSEATAAFGEGSVFIEKYIESPKHIEIQVFGDKKGNVVYLFERECSIQRRYQKVVEEAPSPVVTPELRKQMGEAAVKVAKSCNYYGAGTVEFIMDEKRNFYFLEMNTRLQVEHPVTELITGLDLVKEQIRVAEGEALSFKQEDLQIRGHAIQLRIYAEDPKNNFLPDIGRLVKYRRPQGPGVRVDDGFEEGMDIPIYYDPMIGKLICYGRDREEAITRMIRAIDDYQITGIENTLAFGKFVMQHEEFTSGRFDTHFVKNHFSPEKLAVAVSDELTEVAAFFAGLKFAEETSNSKPITTSNDYVSNKSKWKERLK